MDSKDYVWVELLNWGFELPRGELSQWLISPEAPMEPYKCSYLFMQFMEIPTVPKTYVSIKHLINDQAVIEVYTIKNGNYNSIGNRRYYYVKVIQKGLIDAQDNRKIYKA